MEIIPAKKLTKKKYLELLTNNYIVYAGDLELFYVYPKEADK